MYVNVALFYAAVTVFYFAFQFIRSCFNRVEEDAPQPTIDVYFIVRVFMQDGRWGLVMQKHTYYYRLPMLEGVCGDTIDTAMRASLKLDFISASGKPTRILVFTAPDELAIPLQMPKKDTQQMDAALVIDMMLKMRGEFSLNSFHMMNYAQDEIQRRTGKANFGWFIGK